MPDVVVAAHTEQATGRGYERCLRTTMATMLSFTSGSANCRKVTIHDIKQRMAHTNIKQVTEVYAVNNPKDAGDLACDEYFQLEDIEFESPEGDKTYRAMDVENAWDLFLLQDLMHRLDFANNKDLQKWIYAEIRNKSVYVPPKRAIKLTAV